MIVVTSNNGKLIIQLEWPYITLNTVAKSLGKVQVPWIVLVCVKV